MHRCHHDSAIMTKGKSANWEELQWEYSIFSHTRKSQFKIKYPWNEVLLQSGRDWWPREMLGMPDHSKNLLCTLCLVCPSLQGCYESSQPVAERCQLFHPNPQHWRSSEWICCSFLMRRWTRTRWTGASDEANASERHCQSKAPWLWARWPASFDRRHWTRQWFAPRKINQPQRRLACD